MTANKHTPVDVLAVMDRAVTDELPLMSAVDMKEARAAVAELIAAGSAFAEIVASSDNWTGEEQIYFAQMAGAEPDSSRWVVVQMAQSRFEAALSRMRGAE